jgi:hypothetical protein
MDTSGFTLAGRTMELRSREKMVYGNEVLHKTLSGAIGASRLNFSAGLGENLLTCPQFGDFGPSR